MKTINEFRRTNSFCLTGADAEAIARIVAFVHRHEERLVAIANNDSEDPALFTVRVLTRENGNTAVCDYLVRDAHPVRIEERETIIPARKAG